MKTIRTTRILALGALALLASGCATTDSPYYEARPYPRQEPGIIYTPGAYPVYPVAPPPAEWRRTDRDRWERENRIYERDRERWEKERDRARWERERDREQNARRERDQREQNARRDREAREREMRDREEARRQQAERDRRNRTAPDGGPRRDYDRYNPKTGQWLPRQEDMP
ncbi:MAG: hypothetical protein R3E55_11370 [Burkholderiaceae bacterium]|jgi:hypothetical protein|nr:hypothetical protein [Burkholderiaceae bacterium]